MPKRQRIHFDKEEKKYCKQLKKRKLNQVFQSECVNKLS